MQPNPYQQHIHKSLVLYTERAAKAQKTYKKWSYYKNHAKKARTRKKYLNKLKRAYKKYPEYRWLIPNKDYIEIKHGVEQKTFKEAFTTSFKTFGGNWSSGSGAGLFETSLNGLPKQPETFKPKQIKPSYAQWAYLRADYYYQQPKRRYLAGISGLFRKISRLSFMGNWAGNPVEDEPEDNCSNCQIGADTHEIYPGSCPFYKKTPFRHCKNHKPLRFGEGRWKDE
jgi:hypothetical protein